MVAVAGSHLYPRRDGMPPPLVAALAPEFLILRGEGRGREGEREGLGGSFRRDRVYIISPIFQKANSKHLLVWRDD